MLVEQGLMTYLKSKTQLTSLVGDRINFMVAPENALLPYLTIQKISSFREQAFNHNPGIVYASFQFNAFSNKYSEVKNIIAVLNTTDLLLDFTGNMSGVQVDYTEFANEFDIYTGAQSQGGGLKWFGVAAEWFIYYHE